MDSDDTIPEEYTPRWENTSGFARKNWSNRGVDSGSRRVSTRRHPLRDAEGVSCGVERHGGDDERTLALAIGLWIDERIIAHRIHVCYIW